MNEEEHQYVLPFIGAIGSSALGFGCIVFAGLILIVISLKSTEHNVQLPALVAQLQNAKTLCEARGNAAIEVIREQPQRRAELATGRRLYDEARADLNGCIEYLRAGLSQRPVKSDPTEIASMLNAGQSKADAFVDWANSLQATTMYGVLPTEDMVNLVIKWLKLVNEQDQKDIERLSAILADCRLKDWNQLGPAAGSDIDTLPAAPIGYGIGSDEAPPAPEVRYAPAAPARVAPAPEPEDMPVAPARIPPVPLPEYVPAPPPRIRPAPAPEYAPAVQLPVGQPVP